MWIEVHSELIGGPKIEGLMLSLGESRTYCVGLMVRLWLWATAYAPDGELSAYDPAVIAKGIEFDGDPDVLIAALHTAGGARKAGFVDINDDGRVTVHDWDDYAGRLMDIRERNAERMRAARASKAASRRAQSQKHVREQVPELVREQVHARACTDANACRTTGPNQTNQTKPAAAAHTQAGAREEPAAANVNGAAAAASGFTRIGETATAGNGNGNGTGLGNGTRTDTDEHGPSRTLAAEERALGSAVKLGYPEVTARAAIREALRRESCGEVPAGKIRSLGAYVVAMLEEGWEPGGNGHDPNDDAESRERGRLIVEQLKAAQAAKAAERVVASGVG